MDMQKEEVVKVTVALGLSSVAIILVTNMLHTKNFWPVFLSTWSI
jgi:hypothetical protein